MQLPQSHSESLERQLRVHEERLSVLRWELDNVVPGETSHEQGSSGTVAKQRGSNLRHKPRKNGPDPNPKVRTAEWVTGQREVLEREIRIHEQLIDLGRDPRVHRRARRPRPESRLCKGGRTRSQRCRPQARNRAARELDAARDRGTRPRTGSDHLLRSSLPVLGRLE